MDTTKNDTCRNFDKLNSRRNGKEVSFDFKLFVIDQINNGQISANFASKKYNISRSTIHYWMKKLSNLNQKSENISKDLIIKRLKDKIEDLEAVKEFQQFIIADPSR